MKKYAGPRQINTKNLWGKNHFLYKFRKKMLTGQPLFDIIFWQSLWFESDLHFEPCQLNNKERELDQRT